MKASALTRDVLAPSGHGVTQPQTLPGSGLLWKNTTWHVCPAAHVPVPQTVWTWQLGGTQSEPVPDTHVEPVGTQRQPVANPAPFGVSTAWQTVPDGQFPPHVGYALD